MYIVEESFSLLQDESLNVENTQQLMTDLIQVFIDALQVKPKILKDFSRIVRQGRQKQSEGYLLVDIGPMYVVQLDVNFTPVLNKDAEKGSLDVIWMNQEFTEQVFKEEGKRLWLNLNQYIESTGDKQFVLSIFLKFDRGEYFPENRFVLAFKHIILDII